MTEYNEIYRVIYNYHKRWMPCPATADDWEKAAAEMIDLEKKYSYDKFVVDLLVAVYTEMGTQYKARKEERECG